MTQRTDQVSALLRSELGAILAREIEFPLGVLVTIMGVTCPPDLSIAQVWVSVVPFDQSQEVMELLEDSRWEIQRLLNTRFYMKSIPKIEWRLDRTEEDADTIERLLDGTHGHA